MKLPELTLENGCLLHGVRDELDTRIRMTRGGWDRLLHSRSCDVTYWDVCLARPGHHPGGLSPGRSSRGRWSWTSVAKCLLVCLSNLLSMFVTNSQTSSESKEAHPRCTMTDEAYTDERLWRWQRTLSARVADASWRSRTPPGDDGTTAAARRWSKGLAVVGTTLSEADGDPSHLATRLRAEDRGGTGAEQALT